jgi:hypothetical protein
MALTTNENGADSMTYLNTLEPRIAMLENYVNVKDYGAVGDGVADDTAAVNAALAVANNQSEIYGTILFPKGVYSVDPANLDAFNCHIQAPMASLKANTTSTEGLLRIGASDGQLTVDIGSLLAYDITSDGSRYGYGIACTSEGGGGSIWEWDIRIGRIIGFVTAVYLSTDEGRHIATNKICVRTIRYCEYGVFLKGNMVEQYAVENCLVDVVWMAACTHAVVLQAISSPIIQNEVTIHCLEISGGGSGISMTGTHSETIIQNIIKVPVIYHDGTVTSLVDAGATVSTGPVRNYIEISDAPLSMVSYMGQNILKIAENGISAGMQGRSIYYGAGGSAPTTDIGWKIGDRYIVNNPTAGGVASYCYTSGGWKAETTLAA